MKKYKVKINGKTYTVMLESMEETTEIISKDTEVKEIKEENDKGEFIEVLSPIQGNVINVLVKAGQKVKKGDVLLLIEAMKLENEVNAPNDCEIVEVLVNNGESVSTNQVLVRIK